MRALRRLRPVTRAVVAATVTTVAVVAASANPARADLYFHRDWAAATTDTLGQRYVNTGNIVGFWQAFIAAYGQLSCNGGIDGHFGPATAAGTANLQGFFGLPRDGIVGANTWHAAGQFLAHNGSSMNGLVTFYVPYNGGPPWTLYKYVYTGPWEWQAPAGVGPFEQWHGTGYPGRSFSPVSWC